MPAIMARSAKKSVSYHDLYNLSTKELAREVSGFYLSSPCEV